MSQVIFELNLQIFFFNSYLQNMFGDLKSDIYFFGKLVSKFACHIFGFNIYMFRMMKLKDWGFYQDRFFSYTPWFQ